MCICLLHCTCQVFTQVSYTRSLHWHRAEIAVFIHPPHHLSHTCEIFSAEVTHVQCRIFVTSISHQTDPHKFSRSSATSSCFLLFMVIDCCFLVSQVTIATFADTCPQKTLCNPKNSLLLARSLALQPSIGGVSMEAGGHSQHAKTTSITVSSLIS